MTKEEWSKVEEALKNIYSMVKLKIDGYTVTLRLERTNPYKNVIWVYVNGKFEGRWITDDCEERKRFFCKREKSLLSNKEKAAFNKLSKKAQKEYREFYDRKYTYYEPWWTSFGSLKRHLVSANVSIELVEIV